MVADADLISLYRREMNVWVEDKLTSEYLTEVWQEPRVLFLIGGSGSGIRPVVEDARRAGAENVFGIIDRDFESTNYAMWQNDPSTFVLPNHEMENYLLDEEALANCDLNTQQRTAAEIEAHMHSRASDLLFWMTTIATMKRIRTHLLDEFMTRPKPTEVSSRTDCWNRIKSTDWYQTVATRSSDVCNQQTVNDWIDEEHTQFQSDLASGAWKQSFSGKEIFRDVRGYLYQPTVAASSAVHDVDLAKSVASVHRQGQTASELIELRNHIRRQCEIAIT